MQISGGGRIGSARIDYDELERGVAATRIFQAAKQNWVRVRGVRAGDEHAVGVIDIFVAAGRRVGTERELVSGNGRRHA